jgi:filamentous hemagglutinin family protein
MKYNKNTHNNSLWTKAMSSLMVFVFAVAHVFALPSIDATNLQTTAGVLVNGTANTLSISAPNKAVLNWQAFGSGTSTIDAGQRIEYTLPAANASVLNIVSGGAASTINGAIESNGKVFILNPNGVLIGGTSTINVAGLYVSTVDDPTVSLGYWNTNGKLPSQDNLPTSVLTNGVTVTDGAVLQAVTENITIASRNTNIGGAIVTGNLVVNTYGGNAVLGSSFGAPAVLNGKTDITTAGGNVIIAPNGFITSTGNITINATGALTAGAVTQGTGTLNVTNLNVSGKDVSLPRLTSTNVTVSGNNIVAASTAASTNYNVMAAGNITLGGGAVTLANVTNSGTGDTNVTGLSRIALTGVALGSSGNTTFTAPTVVDTAEKQFVYGPTSFVTTGDVNVSRANHSFGPVSLDVRGNATIVEDATLNFNRVAVTGNLVAASKSDIVQLVATSRLAAGASNLTATNVNLNDPAGLNNLGNVTLTATTDAVLTQARATSLGTTNVGGNLTVSTTGIAGAAVTQVPTTSIDVRGNLVVNTNNAEVSLTQPNNNFGLVSVATGTGAINLNELNSTNIGSLNGGTTSVVSGGDIFNTSAASTNSLVGALTLTAGGNITLSNLLKTSALTFNAKGVTDLSALSFATNLSGVYPVNAGTGTFLPPKP